MGSFFGRLCCIPFDILFSIASGFLLSWIITLVVQIVFYPLKWINPALEEPLGDLIQPMFIVVWAVISLLTLIMMLTANGEEYGDIWNEIRGR